MYGDLRKKPTQPALPKEQSRGQENARTKLSVMAGAAAATALSGAAPRLRTTPSPRSSMPGCRSTCAARSRASSGSTRTRGSTSTTRTPTARDDVDGRRRHAEHAAAPRHHEGHAARSAPRSWCAATRRRTLAAEARQRPRRHLPRRPQAVHGLVRHRKKKTPGRRSTGEKREVVLSSGPCTKRGRSGGGSPSPARRGRRRGREKSRPKRHE